MKKIERLLTLNLFCLINNAQAKDYRKIDLLKTRKLITRCLKVKRDAAICGDLHVGGQITSNNSSVLTPGCQPGPLTIGTSDATDLNLVTQCTDRLTINGNGAVTIHTPEAGETGLTIEGGGEVISAGNLLVATGNIILPQANAGGTQGLLELGGTSGATNVVLYEFGTRNFFAGNQTVNAAVTGADNIAIGTSANSTLTAGNNTIALGTSAIATANDSIAIGNGANSTVARTIVIGSRDSTSTGAAPTVNALNAIAIGSASGTTAGATTGGGAGISAIALGGADGVFAGASAGGNRSIAIGVGTTSASDASILIGTASGTAGGLGPRTVERTAIAIGSAQGTTRAVNSGNTSTIGIGGADGVFAGAAPLGMRSIAIGLNANTGSGGGGAIALGSASGAAGGLAPVASAATSIAIGSARSGSRGATGSGAAGVAIGASDGTTAGAVAPSVRSVAIGTGAVALSDTIVLGNTALIASTAVRIGIGTSTPGAKLDVVGADGVPVLILNQVNSSISNAPVWRNPSTSAVAGTPIHYNASNQLFGFTSSKRYKTNIRPITTESAMIYKLNPTVYDARYGQGSHIPGFIAEEVFEIAPHLVIVNREGQPENIAYNSLHALAIKEIQKHQESLNKHQKYITDNENMLATLTVKIKELQKKVTTF